jgi:hypothetical protein
MLLVCNKGDSGGQAPASSGSYGAQQQQQQQQYGDHYLL